MTTSPDFTYPDCYCQSLIPFFTTYAGGRLCIQFLCRDCGPYATLTTHLPDQHLAEGEFFVKDWSENEPLVKALLEQGWISLTGREVSSGFVFPKVAKAEGPLLEALHYGDDPGPF